MQNYNTNKDILNEAIQSVFCQTFKEFSFVFIDDWSTDYEIDELFDNWRKRWAEKRENMPLFLVKKPQNGPLDARDYNHGHSFCRNWGLQLVKMQNSCEFVFFMDSDDVIRPDCLEILWDNLEKDPEIDISIGNYTRDEATWYGNLEYYYTNDGKICVCNPKIKSNIEALDILCDPYMIPGHVLTKPSIAFCATWNKIFRLSLFDDVKFPDYKTKDDNFTAHRLLWNARKIIFTHEITYFYRPGGNLADRNLYKTTDIVDAHEDRVNFFEEIFVKDIHKLDRITLENYKEKTTINNILINEHLIYLYTLMGVYNSSNLKKVKEGCFNEFSYCLQVWSRELMLLNPKFLEICLKFVEKEKYILWKAKE